MSYPEDTDPADIDAIETLPDDDDSANTGLVDPGVDRHDFATEWAVLWEEAHDDPRETLPELEDLVARLLVRHGYVLDDDDPAAAGEEREILASYASARDVADAARTGPGRRRRRCRTGDRRPPRGLRVARGARRGRRPMTLEDDPPPRADEPPERQPPNIPPPDFTPEETPEQGSQD